MLVSQLVSCAEFLYGELCKCFIFGCWCCAVFFSSSVAHCRKMSNRFDENEMLRLCRWKRFINYFICLQKRKSIHLVYQKIKNIKWKHKRKTETHENSGEKTHNKKTKVLKIHWFVSEIFLWNKDDEIRFFLSVLNPKYKRKKNLFKSQQHHARTLFFFIILLALFVCAYYFSNILAFSRISVHQVMKYMMSKRLIALPLTTKKSPLGSRFLFRFCSLCAIFRCYCLLLNC